MKNLRKTIRRIILENQEHFDKLMELIGSEKMENINQAFELAAGMGYINDYEYNFSLGKVAFLHTWSVSGGYDPAFLEALFLKNRFLTDTNVGNHEDGTSFDFVLRESSYGSN